MVEKGLETNSFSALSEYEFDILSQITKDMLDHKADLARLKRVRDIVPIEDWVNDEYYVGEDGMYLYDYWKDQLIDVFGTSAGKYDEIIVSGGIGCRPMVSRVMTSAGYLSYNELMKLDKEGVRYSVRTESGEFLVKQVMIKGFVPTKRLTLEDRSQVEATYDHRVRVLRDNKIRWVAFSDLVVGDKILKSRVLPVYPSVDLVEGVAYKAGYDVGTIRTIKKFEDDFYRYSFRDVCDFLAGIWDSSGR